MMWMRGPIPTPATPAASSTDSPFPMANTMRGTGIPEPAAAMTQTRHYEDKDTDAHSAH